jgi:small subunit ribosomal protein S8
MQDPIADMLTRIRNGHMAKKETVMVPASKVKAEILKVLEREGYIQKFEAMLENGKNAIKVFLKYHNGKPVIAKIDRISKAGLRIYKRVTDFPKVLGGLGILIVSTSAGIMSDREAKKLGQGGEILCSVE